MLQKGGGGVLTRKRAQPEGGAEYLRKDTKYLLAPGYTSEVSSRLYKYATHYFKV